MDSECSPVKNPVLNTAIVLTGFVSSRGSGLNHLSLPILFDKILEVFSISRGGVGDVMIGEPALEFSLVPSVVHCEGVSCCLDVTE